ncbi:NADH:flavin oxidoreductase/NADH oxidase [Mycena sanguinolenta]|uniref:NADH:flavin oxidoreductase/NADH oxidase n=1 Tax=Mycena sanguinolenta TaxID=230812 RepID=A0A8H6XI97_9AGAR|nr:NADH:flavin oxidoreductase/NADH oxidase [Mycena sanguinolenta]
MSIPLQRTVSPTSLPLATLHSGGTPRPLTPRTSCTAPVEVHTANGYLDQFLHDDSNTRIDRYGESIENRTRFLLEVVDAVVKTVGQKKTALRTCTSSTATHGQRTPPSSPRSGTFDSPTSRAYLHVVEPRVDGSYTVDIKDGYSNDFIRKIWDERRLISAGGYTRESAIAAADEKGDLVAFGRGYIASPDLPYRLLHAITLTVGNRALYYAPGSVDPKGYTDYPSANAIRAY